jgi:hypothetical protein
MADGSSANDSDPTRTIDILLLACWRLAAG